MCLVKKTPKFDEKTRRKIGDLIDEKSLNPIRKTRRKTDHLYVAL